MRKTCLVPVASYLRTGLTSWQTSLVCYTLWPAKWKRQVTRHSDLPSKNPRNKSSISSAYQQRTFCCQTFNCCERNAQRTRSRLHTGSTVRFYPGRTRTLRPPRSFTALYPSELRSRDAVTVPGTSARSSSRKASLSPEVISQRPHKTKKARLSRSPEDTEVENLNFRLNPFNISSQRAISHEAQIQVTSRPASMSHCYFVKMRKEIA